MQATHPRNPDGEVYVQGPFCDRAALSVIAWGSVRTSCDRADVGELGRKAGQGDSEEQPTTGQPHLVHRSRQECQHVTTPQIWHVRAKATVTILRCAPVRRIDLQLVGLTQSRHLSR